MSEIFTIHEAKETSTPRVGYTEISESVADKSDAVVNTYRETLGQLRVSPFDFSDFLELTLRKKNIDESSIIATSLRDGNFFLFLDTGERICFGLKDIQEHIGKLILGGNSQEEVEKRVQNINASIEYIYNDNYERIFQGEIDDDDTLKTKDFGDDLYGKTLSELKNLLDTETHKLYQIYSITGESEKQRELLKKEIQFFAGVGDKYEGGARYFSLSDSQIQEKVFLLSKTMTIEEVFEYIVDVNKSIDENWRKSDMVNQINGKLVQSLYTQTLERLKSENRPNSEFIDFAKVVTGRDIEKDIEKDGKHTIEEINVKIDDDYKAFDIACKALIFAMYRPNGVLETITEKQKESVIVEDTEVSHRTPKDIIEETLSGINSLASNTPGYGQQVLQQAGLGHLIGTNIPYKELSFDDKVSIGAIYRIGVIIKESSMEELQNPGYITKQLGSTVQDSYYALNESFSDNFDGFHGFFGGKVASELGLTGELAEIFDLYQDINGNSGFWDWSDANQDRFGNISTIAVLGIGLIAGAIIFAPVLAAGTSATAGAMLLAGAEAGAITGIASIAFSEQGYDTYYEAAMDSFTQVAADTASGAIFAYAGLSIIKQFRLSQLAKEYSGFSHAPKVQQYLMQNTPASIAPDLLLSREAWTRAGLIDKGFILGEVGISGMVMSPALAAKVREMYAFDHFDSNTHKYVNGNIEKRKE